MHIFTFFRKSFFKRLFILASACSFSYVCGLGAIISGIVYDESDKPVEYASVRLSSEDSKYIKGGVSTEKGVYFIDGLENGKYIISFSCVGYESRSIPFEISNDNNLNLNVNLKTTHTSLDEVVVTGDRFIRTADGLKIYPDKQQKKHSGSGFDLINNLMIPGVSVDVAKGSVRAFGGSVAIYIDGMKSDYREMQQLRPEDVESVQYMEAPTGKYAGDNASINIILKKRTSGGYVSIDALQRLGYLNGDYNLAARYYNKNTQYTLYGGIDYNKINGNRLDKQETILFPLEPIDRNYATAGSRKSNNNQYAQFRIRNKNDRRTLRATFNFLRNATPEDFTSYILTYSGNTIGNRRVDASQNTVTRNYQYNLGLSGNFKLNHNQMIDASASATASRNHYDYCYTENNEAAISNTLENLYNFQGNINYIKNFNNSNSLTIKLFELFNVSSADYRGTNSSWQHLWTSETILFAEYARQLWGIASLRLTPGMSAQVYRQHGHDRVSKFGPRAQIVFTLKPARNQFIQLNGSYGNSYPELSYMNGATQQVDMIQQKKGNPDLKQTKLTTAMGVYGIGFKRLNLQAMLLYNGADDLPLPSYFIEKDMLVQTFDGNGTWRQLNGSLSATWTPSNIFNMQAGGGYMYNRYSRVADLSAACWYATLSANIYLKDFAIFLRGSTPQKAVSLELETVKTIWQYSISATWSKGPFRAEVRFNNPFLKHPYYDMNILLPVYNSSSRRYSKTDSQSAYLKLSYYFDFGKKTKHDKVNIDKTINSGILKAN